ncbi:aspartate--ammonia ligase [Puteibacter caeruleilacunae]|nr:aspartate--ammonia ligase [Puteibacter caeruleilacunae]
MMQLYIPEGYKSPLDPKQTETAIKRVKDFFQLNLAAELRLSRVTAPLFVMTGTGINDDLNGTERSVKFPIKELGDRKAEVVHSLAKWKRMTLGKLGIEPGYGLYTDMNAIRADEELTNIHSLYVDQWDWEQSMTAEQRNLDFLVKTVENIFQVFKRTEFFIMEHYPDIKPQLPEKITFLHTEDLAEEYPDLAPSQRETEAAKKYGAIFIIGIGGVMPNGEKHDGRAPDYDDWTSETVNGYKGLNGDIVLWNPILNRAFEISSMGIRVDKEALLRQLEITGTEERKELLFHKKLLQDEIPLSIGGGIGQSRLCMYFLRKAHIGEVQASIWPDEMIEKCEDAGIALM